MILFFFITLLLVFVLLAPLFLNYARGAPFFTKTTLPLILAAAGVPVGALILYAFLGDLPAYLNDERMRAAIQEQGADTVLQERLARLEEGLVQQPEQKEIRRDLVKAYFLIGRLDKAHELVSHPSMHESEEDIAWALRISYTRGGWNEEVEKLSAALAAFNDEHPLLLSLRARQFYEEKDYDNAVALWQRLLTLELSVQEEQEIQALIREAKAR